MGGRGGNRGAKSLFKLKPAQFFQKIFYKPMVKLHANPQKNKRTESARLTRSSFVEIRLVGKKKENLERINYKKKNLKVNCVYKLGGGRKAKNVR